MQNSVEYGQLAEAWNSRREIQSTTGFKIISWTRGTRWEKEGRGKRLLRRGMRVLFLFFQGKNWNGLKKRVYFFQSLERYKYTYMHGCARALARVCVFHVYTNTFSRRRVGHKSKKSGAFASSTHKVWLLWAAATGFGRASCRSAGQPGSLY